jgi:hypothetical protein
MIAICLVHGGPGPHCFAPSLVEALQKGPMGTNVSLKDLPDPDPDLRSRLCVKHFYETKVPGTFDMVVIWDPGSSNLT